MIKFLWGKSKKIFDLQKENDSKINESIQDIVESNELHSETLSDELTAAINKTYKYEDLPLDIQELVKQIKFADIQIQFTKDTIAMIRPTRDQIYSDLREKLKDIPLL
jgi:outer membrane protein assembly factor BamA